jgi:transposase
VVVCLPSAATRSASPPGGLPVTHHGMSRPRRWGAWCGGALVLALTPVVDLAGPHGRQHLLSSLLTGLTGTDLSLIIAQLFRELEAQGYRGTYASVHDNLVRRLQFDGRKTPAYASSKTPPLATPRQATFLFLRCPEKLRVEEQETLVTLCHIDPEVDLAYDLVQQFAQMLRTRTGEHLDAWLDQVEKSNLAELQSFAAGVQKDKDAVRAGLTWWINNGVVEGHVTKLQLIKRQGYGRAGFPLLRKRVLHAV